MHTRAPVVVGRDEEVRVLQQVLADAEARRGRAVFLVGEPGIGKTRLARFAAAGAFDRGMRVLRGRGSTIGPIVPFRPLAEALMSLLRAGDGPDLRELGPYQSALGRLVPEWGVEEQRQVPSVVVLAEAVLRLLAVVGRDRPCLLVLEDLHDADAETMAVVDYLVDNLDQVPAALLVTTRADPGPTLDVVRLAAQREAGVLLELGRLDERQVRRMVALCLEVDDRRVPDEVVERVWADSAGNPFVVEEILHGLVNGNLLVRGPGGWQVLGELRIGVPSALVRSIAHRTDRLGPQGRELLSAAAVLGHRFPLSVLRVVIGMDDRTMLSHLHAGVAAQLVTPDEPVPDWYAFRHPMTAEALLAQLPPPHRAELARRTADAVRRLHPDLPGEWCALVASLRLDAGQTAEAGALLAEAGRRALADGAAGSAVRLLDHAHRLLASGVDVSVRAEVLDSLLPALAEAGQFERAFALVDAVAELSAAGLDRGRRADLHARLAMVANTAGRWTDAIGHVGTARTLLGADVDDEREARLDALAAYTTMHLDEPNRIEATEFLARRAVDAAERVPLPEVGCEAWQLLGVLARERDLGEAAECFGRARALAEEHGLTIPRVHSVVRQASLAWLADGSPAELAEAREEALRVGAINLAYNVDCILGLDMVLRGHYDEAADRLARIAADTRRLQLKHLTLYVLMAQATAAAHQGRRAEMDAAIEAFDRVGGVGSQERPLCFGLARAFCALLEEDRAAAGQDLARAMAHEAETPTVYHLSGRHGMRLLLGALSGELDLDGYRAVTRSAAAGMRWNRVFARFALAVLLGRAGREAEAARAVREAREAASTFPLARNLGLRLVAEGAVADGWGEPVAWLRTAEEYFHQAGHAAVASACRGLLRQVGASVPQRRTGTDRVPRVLRALGVTVREFEVLELLAGRLGNKAIATRLHISPRTVEKHVASLITKTSQRDREALSCFAASLGPADRPW
ncbi:helix-turn-helix transcriptional regulator [Saccharothrix yanglingensis]|uniref:LuxR family transcriptional regulator n=1 Tax=Saccharothrix yanglingensis TaxID=659496 RepID=A0ABU0X6F6_9PSEU|nr:LuxR family transcriptional regulator [Saccharothrix yanglingensis]MDQ2587701.1 LuxR family transcriptional regulator [Saccharothrix yanglingensis]